jgi:hypothetical protein
MSETPAAVTLDDKLYWTGIYRDECARRGNADWARRLGALETTLTLIKRNPTGWEAFRARVTPRVRPFAEEAAPGKVSLWQMAECVFLLALELREHQYELVAWGIRSAPAPCMLERAAVFEAILDDLYVIDADREGFRRLVYDVRRIAT